MTYQYPKSKDHDPILISLLLGLGITLLIFLLIPLTQLRRTPPPPTTETLEALIPVVLPPPSDLPPPPPHLSEPSQDIIPKWEVPRLLGRWAGMLVGARSYGDKRLCLFSIVSETRSRHA